jgi:hypothetical protein
MKMGRCGSSGTSRGRPDGMAPLSILAGAIDRRDRQCLSITALTDYA